MKKCLLGLVLILALPALADESANSYGNTYEYEADVRDENLVQPNDNVQWKVTYTLQRSGNCGNTTVSKTCRKGWSEDRTVGGYFTKVYLEMCGTMPMPTSGMITEKMKLVSYPASSSLPSCPSASGWTWVEPFMAE